MKADKKPKNIRGDFMSLKNTIAILSSAVILSSPAYAINKGFTNSQSLESTVMQAQSQEDQKYAEMSKLFQENDGVARGTLDKITIEYNAQYKSICTMFYFKDVNIYKYNKRVLSESKRWGKTDPVTNDFTPSIMPVAYAAIRPGSEVPADVKQAADKTGVAAVFDEKTPVLNVGDDVVLFLQNPFGKSKSTLISSTPMADKAYADVFQRILTENNIKDNYFAKK